MANFLQLPNESKYLVPGISLIPEKENGKQHFEDHNILGKYSKDVSEYCETEQCFFGEAFKMVIKFV